ncbi:CND2 protein, partial [Menura novaehollandiae]|nr:CND2 protein [Menura novaehollandiae]
GDDGEGSAPSLPGDEFQTDSPRIPAAERIGEFPENPGSFGTLGRSGRTNGAPLGEGDIGTMCLHLSMNPGEYSYFSPRTLSMWAGPEHWRFRPRRRPDAFPGKEPRKRNTRKVFEVDFEEDIDFRAHFRRTKAPITLAKSILENRSVRSTTLPADFTYDPSDILRLFLKPAVKLSRRWEPVGTLDNEAGIGDYDYDNPNDTSNFCPALQVPDSDDDPDPAEFLGQGGEFNLTAHPEGPESAGIGPGIGPGGDITTYGELNLLAEPHRVNKIQFQYAKTAKKMDMRRLKNSMWELLTEGQGTGTAGEVEDDPKAGKDPAAVAGEKILSGITKDLLHRLPAPMASNLSVPLAFVCLLHLANEKNLKLESTEDLSDVLVTQSR